MHATRARFVLQVESGKTVLPPATYVARGSGGVVDLQDYAVFVLPDGKWVVHMARTDGYTLKCNVPPQQRLNVKCVFHETIVTGLGGIGTFESALTLVQLP